MYVFARATVLLFLLLYAVSCCFSCSGLVVRAKSLAGKTPLMKSVTCGNYFHTRWKSELYLLYVVSLSPKGHIFNNLSETKRFQIL